MKLNELNQEKDQVQAFEDGIKDSILLGPYYRSSSAKISVVGNEELSVERLKDANCYYYEKVESSRIIKGEEVRFDYYLFFRFKEDKEYFSRELSPFLRDFNLKEKSEEFGLLMGYPPEACKEFSRRTMRKSKVDENPDNISISYSGMVFASYPSTILADIEWLLKNKPLREGSRLIIDGVYYLVEGSWLDKLNSDLSIYKQ